MAPSYTRGKQTARQFKVLQLLQNSRFGTTTRELRDSVVEELGLDSLHEKSIKRDIEHWRQAGFPIQRLETANPERPWIWKLDKSDLNVPRLPISVLELLAFAASRELLYPLAGTPYWDGVQQLWQRMRENTSEEVLELLDKQRTGLIVRGAPPKDYANQEGMLSSLNRAVFEHRVTEIKYKSIRDKRAKKRVIEPHAIVLFNNNIYILAAESSDGERPIKTFKLDRIAGVELLDTRFKPRGDFDPEEFFDHSIGIFRTAKAQRFRVKISRERAAWAIESALHPKQKIEPQEDSGVIITIDQAYEEEVLPLILGLGEHAELLEPKPLREKLRAIGEAMVKQYQS